MVARRLSRDHDVKGHERPPIVGLLRLCCQALGPLDAPLLVCGESEVRVLPEQVGAFLSQNEGLHVGVLVSRPLVGAIPAAWGKECLPFWVFEGEYNAADVRLHGCAKAHRARFERRVQRHGQSFSHGLAQGGSGSVQCLQFCVRKPVVGAAENIVVRTRYDLVLIHEDRAYGPLLMLPHTTPSFVERFEHEELIALAWVVWNHFCAVPPSGLPALQTFGCQRRRYGFARCSILVCSNNRAMNTMHQEDARSEWSGPFD